ncbi:Na-translocating system protein MpsC family protein [Planococcus sp. MERTA32b]|nr:Na-translocating system protein MpsC family protein [Planococcus sp. MER TA 32b]
MIFAVLNEKHDQDLDYWPKDVEEEEFYKAIDTASQKAEKIPEETRIYWLSERTILVVREQILVPIEKELIANGYTEELKLAKRPLEKKVIGEVNISSTGVRTIDETFVDWNFDKDIGFFLFVLKPQKT